MTDTLSIPLPHLHEYVVEGQPSIFLMHQRDLLTGEQCCLGVVTKDGEGWRVIDHCLFTKGKTELNTFDDMQVACQEAFRRLAIQRQHNVLYYLSDDHVMAVVLNDDRSMRTSGFIRIEEGNLRFTNAAQVSVEKPNWPEMHLFLTGFKQEDTPS